MTKREVDCPYCGNLAHLVIGSVIYPKRQDLRFLKFWLCSDDSHHWAYVGCHKGTSIPLGRLADGELRKAKSSAHRAFDPLWRDRHMTRAEAYLWLSQTLNIPKVECHIGMFDLNLCKRAEIAASNKLASLAFGSD